MVTKKVYDAETGATKKVFLTDVELMKITEDKVKPKSIEDWFNEVRTLRTEVDRIDRSIEFWENMASRITSNPSQIYGGGTDEDGRFGRIQKFGTNLADWSRAGILSIDSKDMKITKSVDMLALRLNYLEMRKKAELIIEQLECPYKKIILTERYLNAKGWNYVYKQIQYGERHVHRLHNAALEEAENYIEIMSVNVS